MKMLAPAGFAAAALAAAALAMPAAAADLNGGWGRGSIKDDYMAPAVAVSPCYFRADVGYSASTAPGMRWAAWNPPALYNERVTNTSMADTATGGVGAGCGSGSRGFRYEFMLGYHGQRAISGTTAPFRWDPADPLSVAASSKITSSITTYTGMVNGYFDLGNFRGFVPYFGIGVGLAYHQMDEYLISHPQAPANVPWKVHGDNDLTLAWNVMAGVGYQISDRAILDLGYRYIDFGRAATARHDVFAQGTLSRLTVDEMGAHEFKVGLRYHLGGGGNGCCGPAHVPMK
jgi:opacity protein-like surface antigen